MTESASSQTLNQALADLLQAARRAERDLLGSLPPAVLAAPMPGSQFAPKDALAHLSGWKARQALRFAAARRGEAVERVSEEEIDAYNAELLAARRDWSWQEIDAEADQVTDDLLREVLASDPAALAASEVLRVGTLGNGPFHTLEHLGAVAQACGGEERVLAFAAELSTLAASGGLPAAEAGILDYNVACMLTLGGRLDRARGLLRSAFRLNPSLREVASRDTDLAALRDELEALAAQ